MILFILSTKPYDGSDNIYGALRLVKKLVEMKQEVKIFCISDAVDLVRAIAKKPDSYDKRDFGTKSSNKSLWNKSEKIR